MISRPILGQRLYLSQAEFAALPRGKPADLDFSDQANIGVRWLEITLAGIVIRELYRVVHDGCLLHTYKPIIRVRAISRMVPRPQVVA